MTVADGDPVAGERPTEPQLFGREVEEGRLERMLARARLGSTELLMINGEAGIGKTALLDWAVRRARQEGMAVLAARGVESEAEVPFGGLLELLRPALGVAEQLPPSQAEALRGALDLGPRAERDRFLVGAATLNLLSAFSERGPLLVALDDAQWIDDSSLGALVFAARRLVVDPVAVIFAARSGEAPRLEAARLPGLPLAGVDGEAAARILRAGGAVGTTRETATRIAAATGGNPLALVQLAEAGAGTLDAALEVPPRTDTSIENEYARRIGRLPAASRRALGLAAAESSGRLGPFEAAAASLGVGLADLGPAEEDGLLSLGFGELRWRHPLVRSAAYRVATPAERREAHAALAATLPAEEADRRAWHLAAAAIGADEEAAAALEAAAERARAKGAFAEASAAATSAARLSDDDAARARRLFAAAEAVWLAGDAARALAQLEEAAALTAEPVLRAEIEHLRGQVAVRGGDVLGGHEALMRGAETIEALDPAKAIVMLAEATDACVYAGRPAPMLPVARRAYELRPERAEGTERFCASLALGTALIWNGDGEEGADKVREALAELETSSLLAGDPRLLYAAALGPLWLREAGAGPALIDPAIEAARVQGALAILPFALALAGREAAMGERWTIGRAFYEEAIALARDTEQSLPLCGALAGRAILLARLGEAEASEADARESLALAERFGLGLFRIWGLEARVELALAGGRLEEAATRLGEKGAALEELGLLDPDLSPVPDLVEVGVRTGAPPPGSILDSYAEAAQAKAQPWALARLERARGLLAAAGDHEPRFAAALALHVDTPDRFEESRTRLCFGERLRREGRRVLAREQLRPALESFEALGAEPWAERARAELLASGERARRRDPTTIDELTPQELQIGLTLAAGLTTKEAAAKLFLSPKTVEYHLRNAYRKLGIRSREELARELAGADGADAPS